VDWHTYRIAHSVCIEEIVALRAWISKVLAG
jgi:predicted esterase